MRHTLNVEKQLLEGDLNHQYSALLNLRSEDGTIDEFIVNKKLNLSLKYPLNIECQPSYDGTVNLIINDDFNPPRIINTRFSKIENNRFVIVNRNQRSQSNIYNKNNVDSETRLFRTVSEFPVIDMTRINDDGQLIGGNYTFYIKFADSDENETDIVCESGIISIFNGNYHTISSVTGTLFNEVTNKSVELKISNIDVTFPKLYVYYSRETSNLDGTRTFEIGKFTKAYDIISNSQKITIYGYEEYTLLSESDLNINYLPITSAKTQTQVQNMLFFGNVEKASIDYNKLQQLSYYIEVKLKQKDNSIGWISPVNYTASPAGYEYYDPKNIYYNLGYWPGELYRLGVVYIMNDDSLSPVFNLRGCSFQEIGGSNLPSDISEQNLKDNIPFNSFLDSEIIYSNSMGVFKNPDETINSCIQDYTQYQVRPWYYEISLKFIDKLKELNVKGFFIVRQKRIPTILCQGLSLGIDKSSSIPCIYDGFRKKYIAESFLDNSFTLKPTLIDTTDSFISSSGLLSLEATVIPEICEKINGSELLLEKRYVGRFTQSEKHYIYTFTNDSESEVSKMPLLFVKENTPYKYMNGFGFSTRAGSELDAKEFAVFGTNTKISGDGKGTSKLIRGIYTPFIGICGKVDSGCLYNIKTKDSKNSLEGDMLIRSYDNSPFYAVSNRYALTDNSFDVYRGDCFTSTVTIRINRNFRDPDLPINDTIIDKYCWSNHYKGWEDTPLDDWKEINRADVNAVQLGIWVTYKCLSTYNLGLRSEDTSDLEEMALLSTPKSFFPHAGMDTRSAFKISESTILNRGLSSTTSRRWNNIVQNVPYIKNNFNTRIMFSNVFTEENFRNGYRIFQGLSYKDIDRQYGAIVKLLPWGTNLLCIFEHGIGIVPINEKALIQTATNQSIHMYGADVIQNQISLISPDFGSIWQDSIIRTPIGVYGVDTYAKKIWRYSDTKGFETISDMKIQRFLNEHLKLSESDTHPVISIKNVKSHYNNYKGDVMFTFYNDREDETWNFCFNERMNQWITRYSWTPLFSENIDNIFYSFDQKRSKILAHIYNNRNCTYGLRCENNELFLEQDLNEYPLSFIGNFTDPIFEFDSLNVLEVNANKELEINIADKQIPGIIVEDSVLKITYSELSEWFMENYKISVPLHLFVKINCIFDDHIHQEVVGIINKSHPGYNVYTTNGVYVHGRSGRFDELNYSDANMTNQILPTKWYDKQEPFEFEFVVNGDVGFHKIFDNLVIISNNVQPKQFEFSIIGDVYDFNKEGIFRSEEFNEDEWQTANKRKYNDIDYKVSHSFDNCIVEWDNNQNNYWIKLSQDTKNIKDFGRVKGNIHYKEDSWYVTIDPIKFRNKYKIAEDISTGDLQSTRVRDKFMKIRVKYSGEDLVIITALNTLLTISHS